MMIDLHKMIQGFKALGEIDIGFVNFWQCLLWIFSFNARELKILMCKFMS